VPHVLTALNVTDHASVYVVNPDAVPNKRWLQSGVVSDGQQQFGNGLLEAHKFILIPSTVSTHSWNLVFDPAAAAGAYSLRFQEDFALDTRLHPPRTN
jgi:RES domain-containing protein